MEDVYADLFSLVRCHLHIRWLAILFHHIPLDENEACIRFSEIPFFGFGIEVVRKVDISFVSFLECD